MVDFYRPEWVVWENVPGVLSSNGGRDFGAFLGALGELGYGWAYRVLDAQWFGVAQRRRRVFVVGCLGDQASAAAVLFESESVCRDFEKSGKARQGFARGAEGGAGSGGWWDGGDVAATLTKQNAAGGQRMPDKDNFGAVLQPVAHALRGEGFDAGEDGTARGTPLISVAFYDYLGSQGGGVEVGISPTLKKKDGVAVTQPVGTDCYNGAITGDVAATLGTGSGTGVAAGPSVMQPVAFEPRYYLRDNKTGGMPSDVAVLKADAQKMGDSAPHVATAMQVRRLTPVECERLQGFPDGYTNIPWRKKDEAPDGPRYKALGNSMAVPCMRWIGERIAAATRREVKP